MLQHILEGLVAQAAGSSASPGGGIISFLPILLMFVVIYFLMIRPQQKQAQKHKVYLSTLKKGDDVVTQSGIFGKVDSVEDAVVRLEIARDVKIRVLKSQIAGAQPGAPAEPTAGSAT